MYIYTRSLEPLWTPIYVLCSSGSGHVTHHSSHHRWLWHTHAGNMLETLIIPCQDKDDIWEAPVKKLMNKSSAGWKSSALTSEALQPQLRHHCCCTVHLEAKSGEFFILDPLAWTWSSMQILDPDLWSWSSIAILIHDPDLRISVQAWQRQLRKRHIFSPRSTNPHPHRDRFENHPDPYRACQAKAGGFEEKDCSSKRGWGAAGGDSSQSF